LYVTTARDIGKFFGEFILHPTKTGAIAPSSPILAKMMVSWIDLPNAGVVLEYGPGTGAFTEHILKRIPADARFVAIEFNSRLAEMFRQRHPDVTLVEDSVVNVREICGRFELGKVDCIVCGLPWASFPESLQTHILEAMMAVMSPRGQFVTFAYLQGLLVPAGKRFAKLIPQYFTSITKSRTVWLNLPPAFVYQCQR
jgi:phosphatidylethanolamine/phosphatidyl-N-methylethanolamine N-methyltransferase